MMNYKLFKEVVAKKNIRIHDIRVSEQKSGFKEVH